MKLKIFQKYFYMQTLCILKNYNLIFSDTVDLTSRYKIVSCFYCPSINFLTTFYLGMYQHEDRCM